MQIIIREYRPEDTETLAHIFYNTIHTVNAKDYTQEQRDAWAPASSLEPKKWAEKFARTRPWVAIANGQIVGFAEFEPDGHIDCFYCHHAWIGIGVGKALMDHIIQLAYQKGIPRLYAEVSITAKPFFERMGFSVVKSQEIERHGVNLNNFVMESWLT